MQDVKTRICSACNNLKRYSSFHPIDASWCRMCTNTYKRVAKKHGEIAACKAIGVNAKSQLVNLGDIVMQGKKKFVVTLVMESAIKASLTAHRVMENGQILKRSTFYLGIAWEAEHNEVSRQQKQKSL